MRLRSYGCGDIEKTPSYGGTQAVLQVTQGLCNLFSPPGLGLYWLVLGGSLVMVPEERTVLQVVNDLHPVRRRGGREKYWLEPFTPPPHQFLLFCSQFIPRHTQNKWGEGSKGVPGIKPGTSAGRASEPSSQESPPSPLTFADPPGH